MSGGNHKVNSRKKKLSVNYVSDLKKKTRSNTCNKFFHWKSENNDDGSLPTTVLSSDKPIGSVSANSSSNPSRTISFGNDFVISMMGLSSTRVNVTASTGLILDNASTYLEIGSVEIKQRA